MSNLDIIKAACVKANPSILDLQFGCEVKWNGEKGIYIMDIPIRGYAIVFPNFSVPQFLNKGEGNLEILGKKIGLVDILYTLLETKAYKKMGIPCVIDSGRFHVIGEDQRLDFMDCEWNLLDDDLTHQSEPTLSFIASLLK